MNIDKFKSNINAIISKLFTKHSVKSIMLFINFTVGMLLSLGLIFMDIETITIDTINSKLSLLGVILVITTTASFTTLLTSQLTEAYADKMLSDIENLRKELREQQQEFRVNQRQLLDKIK